MTVAYNNVLCNTRTSNEFASNFDFHYITAAWGMSFVCVVYHSGFKMLLSEHVLHLPTEGSENEHVWTLCGASPSEDVQIYIISTLHGLCFTPIHHCSVVIQSLWACALTLSCLCTQAHQQLALCNPWLWLILYHFEQTAPLSLPPSLPPSPSLSLSLCPSLSLPLPSSHSLVSFISLFLLPSYSSRFFVSLKILWKFQFYACLSPSVSNRL